MKRSLLSLGLLFVLHLYFITTSAQVRDIGCLLMCENGLIPGRCQCNPAPRISCSLHCDNGFVPGECRCRPVNAGIQQHPRLSCMVDCPPGTKLVDSECRCENVAGRPLTQRSPCSSVVCSRFQQCRVVNGRGICTASFFHNIFNWPRRPVSDSQTERCQQRVERGRCRASMRRYYYDSRTRRCVRFYYGGCGGNQNNFRTLSECRATCSQTFSSPRL